MPLYQANFGKGIWGGNELGLKGQGWRPKGPRAGMGFLGSVAT